MNQTHSVCPTAPTRNALIRFYLQVFCQAGPPQRVNGLAPMESCHALSVLPKNTTTHGQCWNRNGDPIAFALLIVQAHVNANVHNWIAQVCRVIMFHEFVLCSLKETERTIISWFVPSNTCDTTVLPDVKL